jgi:hypothetical protein
MLAPKFYYHITQQKWPERITLTPKLDGPNRSIDEPETYRTCVSPTIEGCLIALGSCLAMNKKTNIYRTINKVVARNPYAVIDSCITKEKWLTKPIRFMKVGKINKLLPEEIYYLSVGGCNDLKFQDNLFKALVEMNRSFVDFI